MDDVVTWQAGHQDRLRLQLEAGRSHPEVVRSCCYVGKIELAAAIRGFLKSHVEDLHKRAGNRIQSAAYDTATDLDQRLRSQTESWRVARVMRCDHVVSEIGVHRDAN